MKNFLKKILKLNSTIEASGGGSSPVIIQNPIITQNNGCETTWEGSVYCPNGTTGVLTGTILYGLSGSVDQGNNGESMLIGVKNIPTGETPYVIVLANSNIQYTPSSYRLDLTLSDGQTSSLVIKRTPANHPSYDKHPCGWV